MHPNAGLLERFYEGISRRQPQVVADCYEPAATFYDIAFDLHGKREILAMWEMICSREITVFFDIVSVGDTEGVVRAVDKYNFSVTGRPVNNVMESRFRFKDGLIAQQVDSCDARVWAKQALGEVLGFLPGRLRFLRALTARHLLRPYLRHPDSQNQASRPSNCQ